MPRTSLERGFTLVELVVAMTLLALLTMAAAPLLRVPVVAYMDVQRRADALQSLDAIHHGLEADLANALPGSLRVRSVGSRVLLEYLEVRARGRLRAGPSGALQACPATCATAGLNDALEASCADTCFTALGPLDGATPVAGSDWVVVNAQGPGVAGGDPWLGGAAPAAGGIKTRLVATAAASDGLRLSIGAHAYPALAPSRRFYLVSQPVTWDCDPATGRLTRRWGYAIAATQPTAFGAAANAPLASGVTACAVSVQATGSEGRSQVQLRLRLARADGALGSQEAVELVGQYEVGAAP